MPKLKLIILGYDSEISGSPSDFQSREVNVNGLLMSVYTRILLTIFFDTGSVYPSIMLRQRI